MILEVLWYDLLHVYTDLDRMVYNHPIGIEAHFGFEHCHYCGNRCRSDEYLDYLSDLPSQWMSIIEIFQRI